MGWEAEDSFRALLPEVGTSGECWSEKNHQNSQRMPRRLQDSHSFHDFWAQNPEENALMLLPQVANWLQQRETSGLFPGRALVLVHACSSPKVEDKSDILILTKRVIFVGDFPRFHATDRPGFFRLSKRIQKKRLSGLLKM